MEWVARFSSTGRRTTWHRGKDSTEHRILTICGRQMWGLTVGGRLAIREGDPPYSTQCYQCNKQLINYRSKKRYPIAHLD